MKTWQYVALAVALALVGWWYYARERGTGAATGPYTIDVMNDLVEGGFDVLPAPGPRPMTRIQFLN